MTRTCAYCRVTRKVVGGNRNAPDARVVCRKCVPFAMLEFASRRAAVHHGKWQRSRRAGDKAAAKRHAKKLRKWLWRSTEAMSSVVGGFGGAEVYFAAEVAELDASVADGNDEQEVLH